jgi:CheY-like chemotaxis protein
MSIVAVSSEANFLHLIQTLFDGAGLTVRTTSDWDAAPALVTRLRPSLVVLDLRPWEDTCWRVLEALKAGASTHAIPVLVCPVAARLLNGHERLLALPGVHVWPEGFRLAELLETVQFALPACQALGT